MVFNNKNKQKKIKISNDYLMCGSVVIILIIIFYQLSRCKQCMSSSSNYENYAEAPITIKGKKFVTSYSGGEDPFKFIDEYGIIDIGKIDLIQPSLIDNSILDVPINTSVSN